MSRTVLSQTGQTSICNAEHTLGSQNDTYWHRWMYQLSLCQHCTCRVGRPMLRMSTRIFAASARTSAFFARSGPALKFCMVLTTGVQFHSSGYVRSGISLAGMSRLTSSSMQLSFLTVSAFNAQAACSCRQLCRSLNDSLQSQPGSHAWTLRFSIGKKMRYYCTDKFFLWKTCQQGH